jgi:hypothetical protein
MLLQPSHEAMFMHRIRHGLALLVVAAGLMGCATPRYQTVYRYEPPPDAAGHLCLAGCEQKLAMCQSHCKQTYDACAKSVEPLVDERYREAMKRYAMELEQYRWELDRYHMDMALGWGYPSAWHGPFHPWLDPYYWPPTPPDMPSREEISAKIRKEKCDADCGCLPLYDACFLSCGGKKIPEVKCFANCPPEK